MAVPEFFFYSPYQSGVTLTGSNWDMTYLYNGYDNCPAIELAGADEMEIDVSGDSLAAGWLRFKYSIYRCDAGRDLVVLSGGTTDLLRVNVVSTSSSDSAMTFDYWNGSAWTQIGTDLPSGTENDMIDIEWDIDGSSGAFRVYIEGSLHAEVTGDTLHTADTTIDTITFKGADATTNAYHTVYGCIFVDSTDSRGLYLELSQSNGDGNYTDFSNGTYTSVDDYPFQNNAHLSYLIADAAGEQGTFDFPSINTGLSATGTVESVVMLMWAQAQSEPALYMKPLLRKSSTDYNPTGSVQPKSTGEGTEDRLTYGIQIDDDPSTGSAWANAAAVEAFEFGWEASATA